MQVAVHRRGEYGGQRGEERKEFEDSCQKSVFNIRKMRVFIYEYVERKEKKSVWGECTYMRR